MDIFLNKFRLFIIVIMYINFDSIHSYSQTSVNLAGFHTGRRLLYSDWESAPSFYSPGGITPDNEPRAPIYLELINNLTSVNGASGICGVCARIYRVLHMTQLNAAEECRRHHNSRQAAFGDITEFYHTLVKSGRLNGTIEFPLADKFSRFSFRTTILYLASRGNEPGLMIEAGSDTKYVLCVQSIKCPEPVTTTTTSTTEALTTTTLPTAALTNSNNSSMLLSLSPTSSQGRSSGNENDANNEHNNSAFWDTLLSGTEPKSWFLATISLSSLCLLLIIMLIATWLYTCRLRRLYNRRRCHGTCRFGCRCPPEVVRQTAAEAAVCGPLGLQTHQQFTNTMSPQGNGSVRSGSGFGNTLYTGGTLNSGRWGSNGNKIGSPLYVALGSAPDKSALLSAGCNTPSYMLEMSGGLPIANTVDGCSGSCNQTNGKFRNTRLRPKRTSQDALRRSTSEGSSVSGATGTAGANNSVTGIDQNSFLYRSGQAVTFSDATMPNILPSMVVSNTNAGQRGTESTGTVYLQGGPNGYNYSDSGRGSGISPGYSHSPTHGNSRKVNDRAYFSSNTNSAGNNNNINNNNHNSNIQNGLINSNGPINNMDEEEVESKCDMNYLGNQANKILSNLQSDHCNDYNNYNSESHNLPLHHLNRGSEADLLNITPPSGFYDFTNSNNHNNNQHNNSSTNGMVNSDSGYLVSSSLPHNMLTPSPRQQSSHIHQNRLISSPNSFGRQIYNQLPPSSGGLLPHSSGINGSNTTTNLLYPIHGSPTSQGEWQNPMSFTKCSLQNGEMVGSTDEDFINGCPPIMLSTNNTTSENSNTGTLTRTRKYNTPNYNNGNSNGGLRPLVTRPHFSDSLHSGGNNHNLNENNSTTINNRSFHNSNDNAQINDTLITTSKVNRMCVGISERML
uniref:Uncharacterized protein n=1 Tax=Trichobilharzia regenti TaxID=157069 RepID=A0AA85JTQ7_TRIRE|nr:unnamed protein product [Trichobilharzia regenti]